MEITYLIIFGFIVRAIISAITDRSAQVTTIAAKPEPLCASCVYAHIARGYKASQELTFCTYAGVAREVKFAVSNCSMFSSRNAKPELVRITGFAENQVGPSMSPSVAAKRKGYGRNDRPD